MSNDGIYRRLCKACICVELNPQGSFLRYCVIHARNGVGAELADSYQRAVLALPWAV